MHLNTFIDTSTLLPGWRGDLAWIHAWESHAGRPYYPGGAWSGVTLDPGADLGHIDWPLFRSAYGPLLTRKEMGACAAARGLRGAVAATRLENDDVLKSIDITRDEATALLPIVAAPYWTHIARRFPPLADPTMPGLVQTACLSLAYNRGAGNRALGPLALPLDRGLTTGDWSELARAIDRMQNDHPLRGITRRRDAEAALVQKANADAEISAAQAEARERAALKVVWRLAALPPEEIPTASIEDLLSSPLA